MSDSLSTMGFNPVFTWSLEFEIWLVNVGTTKPFVVLHRFPLTLYLLWVSCPGTALGRHWDFLRLFSWSLDKWFLEFPMTLPRAMLAMGTTPRAYLIDICLGSVHPSSVVWDLTDFFRCQVCASSLALFLLEDVLSHFLLTLLSGHP